MTVENIGNNSFYLSKPFPNPVKISAQIKYNLPPNVSSGQFVMYNILGNEVKRLKVSKSPHPIVINASDFKNGTYFYQLEYDGTSFETLIIFNEIPFSLATRETETIVSKPELSINDIPSRFKIIFLFFLVAFSKSDFISHAQSAFILFVLLKFAISWLSTSLINTILCNVDT